MVAYFVDNFDPFIFRLWDNVGPRWYGFAYVLAFLSAYFIVRLLSKRGYCDLPPNRVSDFITWIALFGVLLGGRIGYVLSQDSPTVRRRKKRKKARVRREADD